MAPTVSVVLETENLAVADPARLRHALEALAGQEGREALLEVVLAERGHLPAVLLEELGAAFPWVRVITTPDGLDYYGMKMAAVERVRGDVVLFCDADCVYAPGWLRRITGPFDDPQVQVVAGATRTSGEGPYGLAMALMYIFDAPPRSSERHPTRSYWFNNVAFRRALLLELPLPTGLPLYRGACVLHAQALLERGVVIWREPRAQARHAPPDGLHHFVTRFQHLGSDWVVISRLLRQRRGDEVGALRGLLAATERALTRSTQLPARLRAALAEPGARKRDVVAALPICTAALGLFCVGALRATLGRGRGGHREEQRGETEQRLAQDHDAQEDHHLGAPLHGGQVKQLLGDAFLDAQ